MKRLCDKQTDLLTPNGVRDPIDSVSRVSGEQIRLLNTTSYAHDLTNPADEEQFVAAVDEY